MRVEIILKLHNAKKSQVWMKTHKSNIYEILASISYQYLIIIFLEVWENLSLHNNNSMYSIQE